MGAFKRLGLTRRPQRAGPFILIVCLAVGGTSILSSGYFWNHTVSLPTGLYRRVDVPLSRGVIVQFCPSEEEARFAKKRGYLNAGSCPGGIQLVGKHLMGLPGDTIRVTRRRVFVNDKPLDNSRPRFEDSDGRPVYPKLGTFVLEPGEYYAFSGRHPLSYDSRYFGPVTDVRGVVRPVWVFD